MSKKTAIEVSLFLVAIIWALNFSVIKSSLIEIDPLSFNGLRFVFAAAIIWLALFWKQQQFSIPKKDWLPLFGMGLLGNLLYQGLFIIGIDYTLSANAAVMLGTIPIWVVLFFHFFKLEKMNIFKAAGVVFAFAGIVFIISGGKEGFSLGSDTFFGDVIIILSAVVGAVHTATYQNLVPVLGLVFGIVLLNVQLTLL